MMNKRIKTIVLATMLCAGVHAQEVMTNEFWNNWYVQLGLDMSLQNPYGHDFSCVFPNGKTFGVDAAAGKWFSPVFGVRTKLNWENGIRLLENNHAEWLAPFYQPGVNMDKGGYVALLGDAMFDLHELFGNYNENRKWNAIVYPRFGAVYNFGATDGSPLLGLGIENTYRLNDRWSVYLDVAYNMTSSAVTEPGTTGIGSGNNGYLDVGIGVQVDLGKRTFDRVGSKHGDKSVIINDFWDNWFIQMSADMTLQNPYGYNFAHVFPNGKSYGLNVAVGKWFTPEIALRGRLNWENGLIENKQITWLPPVENPRDNYKGGGFVVASLDALLDVTNCVSGYDENRKWNLAPFVRAGIISHLEIGSGSPLVGAGIENSYRLNKRLSLFADVAYQVTTGESSISGTGATSGSNGFFDIDFGVTYDLGLSGFYKDQESKRAARKQMQSKHEWSEFIVNTIGSVGVAFGAKTALKAIVKEERPDHTDNQSFPSGHAAMAFAAARSIDKEFRHDNIWIPIVGYGAATAIGVERVLNDRHHWYDVVAGAGIGIAATELTWWLTGKITKQEKVAVGVTGNSVDVAIKL